MSQELVDTVLRSLLPDNHARLYYAQQHLDDEMFSGAHADLWKLISAYQSVTQSILDDDALAKVLAYDDNRLPIEAKAELEELWFRLKNMQPVTEPDFRTSVHLTVQAYTYQKFGQALADSGEIMTVGKAFKNLTLVGVKDAIDFMSEKLAEVNLIGNEQMPEGEISEEYDELISELQVGSAIKRIPTGIKPLDRLSHGGIGAGELWIPAAYTGVGKSTLCINIGHQAMMSGENVLYLTGETLRQQIRRRLLVRHGFDPKFGHNKISLDALNKHNPENPTLTPEHQSVYQTVAEDLTSNPDYGKFIIAQIPEHTSFNTIRAICNKWNKIIPIGLIIIDSLDLIASDRNRKEKRDELNEVIFNGKNLAVTFDEGRGVAVLSPWQTSRAGYERALEKGRYDIRALGETSEIERRADMVFAMLEDLESTRKLRVNVLKWRDGRKGDMEFDTNLDVGYIGSSQESAEDDLKHLLET